MGKDRREAICRAIDVNVDLTLGLAGITSHPLRSQPGLPPPQLHGGKGENVQHI